MEPKRIHPDRKPFHSETLDQRWVLVGYLDKWEHSHLMEILETDLDWAYRDGWSLVFRWRDNPITNIDPNQSNPNRTGEDEGD